MSEEKIKLPGAPVVHLVCQDCGQAKPDVHETMCPYAQEINGEDDPCVVCDDCYQHRCDEI